MKRVIGYTTTAEFPVAISYKCPYCGTDNTRTVYLQGKDFDFTRAGSSSSARNILQERLDALLNASDVEEFKSAGLHCVCKKCAKAAPWNDTSVSTGTTIRLFIVAIIAIVAVLAVVLAKNTAAEGFFSSILASDYLSIIIPVVVIVLIGIIVLVSSLASKKKPAPIPEDALPKVIAFGEEAKQYAPSRSSIY